MTELQMENFDIETEQTEEASLELEFHGLGIKISGKKQWIDYLEPILIDASTEKSKHSKKTLSLKLSDTEPPIMKSIKIAESEIFRNDDVLQGRYKNKFFTKHKDGYGYVCEEDPEGNKYYSWGPRADLGALSIIKIELLKFYNEQSDNFLIIHGGSVVDERTGKTLVLTGTDYIHPRGNAAGKTTAVMSLTMQSNSPFDYLSNDEVVLSKRGDEELILPIPSTIALRQGSIDAIQKDGIELQTDSWTETDRTTGEITSYISPASIKEAGFGISKLGKNVEQWFFVNLSTGDKETIATILEHDEAKRLFMKSIFYKRMNQIRDKSHLGEFLSDRSDNPDNIKRADKFFEFLEQSGVKFILLTGSIDRNKIYKTIKALT